MSTLALQTDHRDNAWMIQKQPLISPKASGLAEKLVAAGKFRSVEEAVEVGMDLLYQHASGQQELRELIQVGIDQADAGLCRPLDMDDVIRRAKMIYE